MDDDHVIAQAAKSAAVLYKTNGWKWSPDNKGGTLFVPDAIRLALSFQRLLDGFLDSDDEEFRAISRRGGRLMVYRTEDSVILAVEVGQIPTGPYEGLPDE